MPESFEITPRAASFVEVALPIPPRQTFTYRRPNDLKSEIKLGARVLVPFGKRTMTGYVVALHAELADELGIDPASVKNILELVDETPLISSEMPRKKWTCAAAGARSANT